MSLRPRFRTPENIAMGLKAAIFDVDGTLLDSVDLHAQSWVETLSHFGVNAPFEEVRNRIGEGADRLMPHFLPEWTPEERKTEIEKFRADLFKRKYLPRVRPFPGVRELCERLKTLGLLILLGSSCTAEEIQEYKLIAAISDLVDFETTSDDASSSKPAPDIFVKAVERISPIRPSECVVIGDTRFDGEAASKAGIPFLGVLCGGSSEDELKEAGAIGIYKNPADLLSKFEILSAASTGGTPREFLAPRPGLVRT
jgi:HAD superfamily hydrolase (TIGR01509 family)